ncbi:uncharacterized protein TNCV_855371 [Trichonephila clavipes]|nr:uncharacterized protein TNCV_855371 [Trichonephila clavipes]
MSVNTYDVQVEKLESIGLIKKCMCTHLLDLKSETQEKKLNDVKSPRERNRLPDILLSKIQSMPNEKGNYVFYIEIKVDHRRLLLVLATSRYSFEFDDWIGLQSIEKNQGICPLPGCATDSCPSSIVVTDADYGAVGPRIESLRRYRYGPILLSSFLPHPSERNAINIVQFSDKSTENFPVICNTDGSKIDGRVGFAFVVFRNGVEPENFQLRIRDEGTVFVAELLCLNFAVKWITEQKK